MVEPVLSVNMALSDCYGITYKMETSEKFDEFMKGVGVGLITRKLANSLVPTEILVESDGVYTLTSSSPVKTTVLKFRLGEEFADETADGRKVKSTVTLEDGNKLVHVMKGAKVSKAVREFRKDLLIMVLTVDDIVCTRIYKPVQK